jgi:ubiquitin C-terminal hydrolase
MCDDMRLARKTLSVQLGPSYLLIQLKRFRAEKHKKVKNNEPVDYDEELILADRRYRLLAVVVHEGSMEAGHYWAIRREGGAWVRRDDEESGELGDWRTANAYLLLYGQ